MSRLTSFCLSHDPKLTINLAPVEMIEPAAPVSFDTLERLTERIEISDENNTKLVNNGLLGIQAHTDSLRKQSPFAKQDPQESNALLSNNLIRKVALRDGAWQWSAISARRRLALSLLAPRPVRS